MFTFAVDLFDDRKPYTAPSRLVTKSSHSGDEDAISDFILDRNMEKRSLTPGYVRHHRNRAGPAPSLTPSVEARAPVRSLDWSHGSLHG